jgi:hypothetical protein
MVKRFLLPGGAFMLHILSRLFMRPVSCLFLLLLTVPAWSFDLTRHSAPVPALSQQVIPKDAIPAIENPELIPASQAEDVDPEERIIGVVIGEEARAHPIRILNSHEIVNDTVQDQPIAVTW